MEEAVFVTPPTDNVFKTFIVKSIAIVTAHKVKGLQT